MQTQSIFDHLYRENKELSEQEITELKDCHILFIPGIFSKFIHLFIGKYFKPQIKFLKKHGIDNYTILWSTELSCEGMAKKIKEVADRHKKILVITHSKGGIDFLTFLVNHPNYQEKLKGWLCLQAPIWGSQFADFLYANPLSRSFFKFTVVMYGGESKSAEQLTTHYRKNFMINNKAAIEDIVSRKNILFLASSVKSKKTSYGLPLMFGNLFYKKNKMHSDGLVEIESAAINRVDIRLDEVDHASTVLPAREKNFSNMKATSAFFRILILNAKSGI